MKCLVGPTNNISFYTTYRFFSIKWGKYFSKTKFMLNQSHISMIDSILLLLQINYNLINSSKVVFLGNKIILLFQITDINLHYYRVFYSNVLCDHKDQWSNWRYTSETVRSISLFAKTAAEQWWREVAFPWLVLARDSSALRLHHRAVNVATFCRHVLLCEYVICSSLCRLWMCFCETQFLISTVITFLTRRKTFDPPSKVGNRTIRNAYVTRTCVLRLFTFWFHCKLYCDGWLCERIIEIMGFRSSRWSVQR